MRRCNDVYEIVTVYYPTGCVNTTRTTTSTSTTLPPTTTTTSSSTSTSTTTLPPTTTTTSSSSSSTSTTSTSSTTTTTTTSNYNSYNYQAQYYDCDTCVNIGGISLANIEPLTVGKWYNYTNVITNISRKIQIVTYIGPSLSTYNAIILDSTKQDTCGALPPCP